MSTRVIAFINFKGGVGKTANVVNIGAALAKANAIPLSKDTSKEKLIEMITHYARRAHSNIRHRA
ncbi:MAG: AAA family ATPase [Thermodesulfobacteriota bacterium]